MINLSAVLRDRAAVMRRSVSLSYLSLHVSGPRPTSGGGVPNLDSAACRIKGNDFLVAVSPAYVGLHLITGRRQIRQK